MNYFKTTDAEAAALDDWIAQQVANPGKYKLFSRNCADFTGRGLAAGGAFSLGQEAALPTDPNDLFLDLIPIAAKSDPDSRPHVDAKIIYYSPDSPVYIPADH